MTKQKIWKKIILNNNKSIKDVIKQLNYTKLKFIIVVDDKKKFLGTITDGDLRRGLLKGLKLNNKLIKITNTKSIYVTPQSTYGEAKLLMVSNAIQHIPIVDNLKKVVGLHLLNDRWDENLDNTFVIMAGGFGKRLRPFTNHTPKSMLKVANKPILEHIIESAKRNGFKNFVFCVHYLHKKIQKYFKNGKKFAVKINYIYEKTPKGTAGGLKNIKVKGKKPILVTNGDVLSDVNYSKIIDYHNENKSDATVVVRNISQKNPYGIVKLNRHKITGFAEKQDFVMNINTGIYVLSPNVLKFLDKKKEDMPNFLEKIRKKNKKIIAYPLYESWIDIGTKKNLYTYKRRHN